MNGLAVVSLLRLSTYVFMVCGDLFVTRVLISVVFLIISVFSFSKLLFSGRDSIGFGSVVLLSSCSMIASCSHFSSGVFGLTIFFSSSHLGVGIFDRPAGSFKTLSFFSDFFEK